MKNDQSSIASSVDLTSCDREPIHLLAHTQSFGCLVALRYDWIIAFCSANATDYFRAESDDIVASPFSNWVDAQLLHDIRSAYQAASITGRNERLFNRYIEKTGVAVDISVHDNGTFIIVEFEKITADRVSEDSFVRAMLGQFHHSSDSQTLISTTAQYLQLITGYDRVMIYQFLSDGSGEVVAEAKSYQVDAFLGLRYPASDIPRQARALYLKNLLRVIHDVHSEPVPVVPGVTDEQQNIDLSLSTLRAVSPVHIQYLKNMGVEASLSVSIVINGKLWGLIACHHYSPKVPSYFMRTELELFAEIFSLELTSRLMQERETESNRVRNVHNQIMATIGGEGTLIELLKRQFATMRSLIDCDGIGAVVDEEYHSSGVSLRHEQVRQLTRYLNRQASSEVIAITSVAKVLNDYDTQTDKVAGVLAIPISKNPRDYLLFFRNAQTQTVNWAGNPDKPVTQVANEDRLAPRESFALWQQTYKDQCEHWQEKDINSADSLRVTLLEVIIRHLQDRSDMQQQARRKHEVLISELNHRVRNILNLVNAIVVQTDQSGRTLDEFVETLSGRIVALASAHDQLTASHWDNLSFRQLITTEIQAYIQSEATIRFDGPEVAFVPDATTPVVLVIHELFTNAAKYGALSPSEHKGSVALSWYIDARNDLQIAWYESGGPPVKIPEREGFGMILIKNTVPHELGGDVDVRFEPDGLKASIRIPNRFFTTYNANPLPIASDETPTAPQLGMPESALVIEDSLVIALDMQKKLKRLGIGKVFIAGNLQSARQHLDRCLPELLVSDVHLGDSTTFDIIEQALKLNIPSIIVSGYGDALNVPAALRSVPLLTKPVSDKLLHHTLYELLQP